MNKNSIENFMARSSLFRGPNTKVVPSYSPHLVKTATKVNNQVTPTKTQYTPANPMNYRLKEKLLCKSCNDRKSDVYRQDSLKLNELQGVEKALKEGQGGSTVRKEVSYEDVYLQNGRPPNFINQTVAVHPKINQFQRSPPATFINTSPPKQIQHLEHEPIFEERFEQSTDKEASAIRKGKESESIKVQPHHEAVNILINNESLASRTARQSSLLRTSSPDEESRTQRLRPQSTQPFRINRTQSDYLETENMPRPVPSQSKKIQTYRQTRHLNPPMTKSSIIKNEAYTNADKNRQSSHFERMVPVSSIGSNSFRGNTTLKDTYSKINPSSIMVSKHEHVQKENFFNSTKRDTNIYIESIRQRLRASYGNLEAMQSQIDVLIQKNLSLQCQKIKASLYKIIDFQLKQFVQSERQNLSATKFSYMSDLYEIKCNIDLRLQELQDYQSSFASDQKWKAVVGDLLTPDYESTIQFLIDKSTQIQEDSLSYTQQFINQYNNKMFYEVNQPLRRQMKVAIQSLFYNFTSLKERKNKPVYGHLTRKFYEEGPPKQAQKEEKK